MVAAGFICPLLRSGGKQRLAGYAKIVKEFGRKVLAVLVTHFFFFLFDYHTKSLGSFTLAQG